MKCRSLKNNGGFTLVEVLVAMTILSIGLLSIAGMQVIALRTNASANTLTTNASLAESTMEQILSWPLGDSRLAADVANVAWVFDATTTAAMNVASTGGGTYTATYSVDIDYDVDAAAGPIAGIDNITRIEVKVTQSDGGGRTLTLVGFKRAV